MARTIPEETIQKIREGDARTIARALTRVENGARDGEAESLVRVLYPMTGSARIIGITGSPGAGKSTLVDQITKVYRKSGRTVGILAIDPTSPFSGGAVLGDRIRMQSLASDPGVFIRSMATRGQMGGLAPSIHEALVVLDAAGYEILIVETVGVGQDEVDIVKAADVSVVVLVPGMGDDIQTIKAGIMEIGDVFVINKADREGVQRTEQELQALLSLGDRPDGWTPPIVPAVATRAEGIEEVVRAIEEYVEFLGQENRRTRREFQASRDRVLSLICSRVTQSVISRIPESELNSLVQQVVDREVDPFAVADQLVARLGLVVDFGEERA